MKRACLLLAILSCATSVNARFNCWDEAEAVVCKDSKTGQIIRRTVDPSGVITYRNNRGQRIHVHEGRFGERVFKNEYGRQFDPYAPPKPTVKEEVYRDDFGNKIYVKTDGKGSIYRDEFGNEKLRISKDLWGNTVYTYPNGYKITKEKNINNSITYKDSKYNRVNVKQQYNGDITYTNKNGLRLTKTKDLYGNTIYNTSDGYSLSKEKSGDAVLSGPNGLKIIRKVDIFGNETFTDENNNQLFCLKEYNGKLNCHR